MENFWKKYWNVFTKTQLFDSYDTEFFENWLLLWVLYDTHKIIQNKNLHKHCLFN